MTRIWTALQHVCAALGDVHREQMLMWELFCRPAGPSAMITHPARPAHPDPTIPTRLRKDQR